MVKQYVLCISNAGYPASLELRKIYELIPNPEGERFGMLRVVDESGEDYLFEADVLYLSRCQSRRNRSSP